MASRVAAAVIAGAALIHVLIIALAPIYAPHLLTGPVALLAAAFLLALAALFSAVWVLLGAGGEQRIIEAFRLYCGACGHPADAQCSFCTRCGEHGTW